MSVRVSSLRIGLILALAATVVDAEAPRPAAPALTVREPIAPIPPVAPLSPERVALGERLFREPRLSGDGTRSCAACHPLEQAGMDGQPRALAADGRARLRNTPTVFNVASESFLNWDGAAESLETHAEMVLLNPDLMNVTWPALLARLRADASYVSAFRQAYSDGLTSGAVLDALATFERSLQTPEARFDRYLRGDETAVSRHELRGYQLFKSYGCVTCHQGANVGGNMFQRFGIFPDPRRGPTTPADDGRYAVTRAPRDRGVFRVPSLRNVALTAPYFHDGRAATLAEAVDTMAAVQLGRILRPEEIELIVSFLGTLTGQYQGAPLAPPRRRAGVR